MPRVSLTEVQSMANQFVIKRRVQFAETDAAGVLHFANYFRLMEEAEHAYWRSMGLSVITADRGRQISWPRVATSCEYFLPARFEDELELVLEIEEVGNRSLTYKVAFGCRGKRIAVGTATIVCCELIDGSFKAAPLPEVIRSKLTGVMTTGH